MWQAAWRRLTTALAAVVNWRFFKPAVFLACAIPLITLGYRFWRFLGAGDEMALGVDPNKTLMHETGEAALAILLLTLSVTPVRRIFKVNKLHNVRRMLGLWSFAYAVVHLSMYLVFDQLCYSLATCDFAATWQDILKRRFIFVGQFAFLILFVLAVTSTTGWMRRLKKNWTRLHRLVYVAAAAGVVHFLWIQKSDFSEPVNWAIWLAVLLGIRVFYAVRGRQRTARIAVTS
jgi:sulfoxide reductase heme-binding subunit YedZ